MRVVHVMWRLSQGGGVPIVVRNILTRSDPSAVDLHVVTVRPRLVDDRLDELPGHVSVHALGYGGAVRPWHRVIVMVRVALALLRLRPHVVQAHTGTAWLTVLGRIVRPRTPFVLEVHDAPGSERHSVATDRFEGFLVRRCGYTALCHSTSVLGDIGREWRVAPARVELFPLGIDTGAFSRSREDGAVWRTARGFEAGRPIVLYVARLVATKNVPLLIDVADRCLADPAVKALRPLFVVVANGSQAVLQTEIDERGLTESFVLAGPMYLPELADAYAGSDVFCSTSDYEGFGLAIVEAMASGLPVVATAVGGVTDLVVDGETGSLVPRGDAVRLTDSVSELLTDATLRRARGRAGRERARGLFDVERMVRDFEALYVRRGSVRASRHSTRGDFG